MLPMTYEDMQNAIRALTGWELDVSPQTELSNDIWYRHGGTYQLKRDDELPNYMDDLDAMHKIAKTKLDAFQWEIYREELAELCTPLSRCRDKEQQFKYAMDATAPQRAEAFLKAKGLYVERPMPAAIPPPSKEAMEMAARMLLASNELDRP